MKFIWSKNEIEQLNLDLQGSLDSLKPDVLFDTDKITIVFEETDSKTGAIIFPSFELVLSHQELRSIIKQYKDELEARGLPKPE